MLPYLDNATSIARIPARAEARQGPQREISRAS